MRCATRDCPEMTSEITSEIAPRCSLPIARGSMAQPSNMLTTQQVEVACHGDARGGGVVRLKDGKAFTTLHSTRAQARCCCSGDTAVVVAVTTLLL